MDEYPPTLSFGSPIPNTWIGERDERATQTHPYLGGKGVITPLYTIMKQVRIMLLNGV